MKTGGDSLSKYETAPYKVLEKEELFEIRQYDAFYTAAVEEDTLEGSSGFRQIFDYISGNNEDQTKISMTTPVFNEMKKKGHHGIRHAVEVLKGCSAEPLKRQGADQKKRSQTISFRHFFRFINRKENRRT